MSFDAHSSAAVRATLDRLRSFLAHRLGSDDDAASIVGQHLAAALRCSDSLPAATSIVARWQQILRHAIVDYVRGGVSPAARDRAWEAILSISHAQHHHELASCFAPLIAELPLDEALLLHHVEMLGHPLDSAARELGHSPADGTTLFARAEVRLHDRVSQMFDRRLSAPAAA